MVDIQKTPPPQLCNLCIALKKQTNSKEKITKKYK